MNLKTSNAIKLIILNKIEQINLIFFQSKIGNIIKILEILQLPPSPPPPHWSYYNIFFKKKYKL